jgi:protein-disulfide isomerase
MHDMLFEHQHQLTHFSLVHYAKELHLDIDVFENDLADPTLAERVEKDFYSGMRSGVSATPTFYINGEKYTGSWEPEPFLEFLQNLV